MCLITDSYKRWEEAETARKNPLIAKKDIPVFKLLDKQGYSPFRGFKYQKGYHYNVKRLGTTTITFINLVRVDRGLHAYTTKNAAIRTGIGGLIVKMYVPKGSKYFVDKRTNEIVSDNLIWY